MEHRDRGKRIEVTGNKRDVLSALEHFLTTEDHGRVGFEKEGESFSMWATSETEPMPT